MKKNFSIIVTIAVLAFSNLACNVTIGGGNLGLETVRGSGGVVEENRTLGDISSVELAMPGTLYIEMGDGEMLRIEAQENLLEYIETDVRADELIIATRQRTNLRATEPINYYLTVDELSEIQVSSSGDVESGDLQSGSFTVTISSSGDVFISELIAETVDVNISSSGNLEIAGGEVQQQNINISSSGDYNARDLASVDARVNLSSSGSATIQVSDQLNGSLSSSGDINYIGDPEVDVNTTSSGRVVQIGQ